MLKFFIFFVLCNFTFACRREPSVYHSRVDKIPGDNGYAIKLQDNMQKYVPGEIYTGRYKIFYNQYNNIARYYNV